MENEQQDVGKILRNAPLYLTRYFVGFVTAFCSDVTITSLVFAGVAFGLAIANVWAGLALFFTLYVFIRMAFSHGSAIVLLGKTIHQVFLGTKDLDLNE